MDFLFNEYQLNRFADIDLSTQNTDDPKMLEIIKCVEAVQKRKLQFEDIPTEYRKILADLIYRV
jgi:hypothetical protein